MEELPRQAHDHVELIGGPLDGLRLDVSGVSGEVGAELREGAFLVSGIGEGPGAGTGAGALYRPRRVDPCRWDWAGGS
ncbi:hypothetical protein [Streptomyces sp. NPDC048172]|uniref:hypothetical protein n=1 Tax=Streptomyces sp. NPDC048172 TaxID=3365505 RepID=UPI003710A730